MAYTNQEKLIVDSQKLNVGSPLVELYVLDSTAIGGTRYYFTPATSGGAAILFGGIQYNPLPVEFDGLEMSSTGQLARPKIRVGNVNKDFLAIIRTSNQLLGSTVTRRRTFAKYLDLGSDPSSDAIFPEDVYVIERLTKMDKTIIEWELKSEIDLENVFIPKRQVLDLCSHIYRSWDVGDGAFDYTNATCPYTGTSYFDLEDTVCLNSEDICSKKLNACQLRFGTNNQLPYRGFPGIGKLGYPYR